MKKLFSLLLAIMLMVTSISCKADVPEPEPTPTPLDDAELAQNAYDFIESAERLCKSGLSTISIAWHFGIWDASDCTADTIVDRLAAQIGFSSDFINENGGHTPEELINGNDDFPAWEFCLVTAENCLYAAGSYDVVDEALDSAKEMIKTISEDYTNYQDLKDYYISVAAYAAFFDDIGSISYNDLQELMSDYESSIKTAKEALLFDFG